MSKKLTKSDNFKDEYCCTVVQIGEIKPIEGKDLIGQTLVNGLSIVIRKDQVKEGDILFYASNESQLNSDFLRINNLFEDRTRNSNPEERGYFNQYGRVRMIKLGGCPSMGYLFSLEELQRFCPDITSEDIPAIGTDFDTVNDTLFIRAFVPPIKGRAARGNKNRKRDNKLKKFDRMIPGEFRYHFETQQLNKYITSLTPANCLSISVKTHGTSSIIGNMLVKKPKYNSGFFGKLYNKYFVYLPKFLQFTKPGYEIICSSRSVIINSEINPNKSEGYAGGAVQKTIKEYADLLGPYISRGMTIYSEIVGYYTGTSTPIQKLHKPYDYGCQEGENKIMPYRITTKNADGTFYEWNVSDVYDWTIRLMDAYPELANRIQPIVILYHGTLADLYPQFDPEQHWHENVLEALKTEKRFGMEEMEPLCLHKVPREGIVVRIDNDPNVEAFKLKCLNFLGKESASIDSGEVDSEMLETDY